MSVAYGSRRVLRLQPRVIARASIETPATAPRPFNLWRWTQSYSTLTVFSAATITGIFRFMSSTNSNQWYIVLSLFLFFIHVYPSGAFFFVLEGKSVGFCILHVRFKIEQNNCFPLTLSHSFIWSDCVTWNTFVVFFPKVQTSNFWTDAQQQQKKTQIYKKSVCYKG